MKAGIIALDGIFKAQKELFEKHGYCLGRTEESFKKDLETLEVMKRKYL